MKKLQNNFTTPEQSKRLLELGVPANSADCYHNDIAYRPFTIPQGTLFSDPRHMFTKETLPCWSVGRLIEIYMIAAGLQWIDLCLPDDFTESIIKMFEGTKDMDFSKLEE